MKIIHINRFLIEKNAEYNQDNPVVRVEEGDKVSYCMEVNIKGPSRVVYNPYNPWRTGAKLWIETDSEIELIGQRDMPGCG